MIIRLSQFNLTKFDCQLELSLAIFAEQILNLHRAKWDKNAMNCPIFMSERSISNMRLLLPSCYEEKLGFQYWIQYFGSILGFNIAFNIAFNIGFNNGFNIQFNIGFQYLIQYLGSILG